MILRFAADKKTLYVSRPLKNAAEFIKWAKAQGFEKPDKASEMHVTIAYSEKEIDWTDIPDAPEELVVPAGDRTVEPLGDDGAVVLKIQSKDLAARHKEIKDAGASWNHTGYRPHVTITYEPGDVDLDEVEPYDGELVFGPERFKTVDD